MMRVLFLLLAPLAFVITMQAQSNLSIQVLDSEKQPVSGAIISIKEINKTVETNTEGKANFIDLYNASYTLNVYHLGYLPSEKFIKLSANTSEEFILTEKKTNLEEVIVSAVRAQNNTPTTFTLINKRDIKSINTVQDAPYLLAYEPSVVVTSDAGAGIGYTGMRIRGIDSKKINVTINGIPLNDAESHGVYWVDVPDIASSAQSIQIQRGVGTSTNGAGAFGSSINLSTDNISEKAFVEYNGAAGSFNTFKNSVHVATGKFNENYFFEAKVSGLKSDGYRDRSWSNLKSYFAQTGYVSDKTIIKLVAFGGWEETYQAWFGVDSATMKTESRKFNYNGAIYNPDYSIKGYYNNHIDHYQQDHLQLHWVEKFSENLKLNTALHYTYGRGYYEEYMQDQNMQFYGLTPIKINDTTSIESTDLVRRLWLDNKYFGGVWGLTYTLDKLNLTWGGGMHVYDPGKHYGEVIWAQYYTNGLPGKNFYENTSNKNDFNSYLKASYQATDMLLLFADYQIRHIKYDGKGFNKEYADNAIDFNKSYLFSNPKAGILFQILPTTSIYTSFAVAHREPTRDDIIESTNNANVKSEELYDWEAGVRHNGEKIYGEVIFYNMQYNNQLVLTGELNDEGSFLRTNVGKSLRRGLELMLGYKPFQILRLEANATLSSNKIDAFYRQINDTTVEKLSNVTTAFSPSLIAGSKISCAPFKNFETTLYYRFVGKQYLDNTETELLSIKAYNTVDLNASYSIVTNKYGQYSISFRINNLLDEQYNSNGSVSGGTAYYYPQAGRNLLMGLNVRF